MLLDVNVLLALSWDQHVHHRAATERFATLESWCTCPTTETGLIRLLLNEHVVGRKVSSAEALGQLGAIRTTHGWQFLDDTTSFAEAVIDTRVLMGHRQVTDLALVNIAASHDVQLATFDASLRDTLMPDDQRWVVTWSA